MKACFYQLDKGARQSQSQDEIITRPGNVATQRITHASSDEPYCVLILLPLFNSVRSRWSRTLLFIQSSLHQETDHNKFHDIYKTANTKARVTIVSRESHDTFSTLGLNLSPQRSPHQLAMDTE